MIMQYHIINKIRLIKIALISVAFFAVSVTPISFANSLVTDPSNSVSQISLSERNELKNELADNINVNPDLPLGSF